MSKKNQTAQSAPVAKLRIGSITASIWENPHEKGTFYGVTFARGYKDGEGNWQSSHSFNADDLLVLAKLADMAHTKIIELQN